MTTSINWPSTLPQQFLIDGFSKKSTDVLIRTSMDAAVAKQRPRYYLVPIIISGSMIMTTAQLATFEDFFTDDLDNGALEFNMNKIGNNASTQIVRFNSGEYTVSPIGTSWNVNLTLEILP